MLNLTCYNLTDYEMLSLQQEYNNFILSIIVAVITFISVLLIYLDYRNRKNKERAEKSIEIAKQFANHTLINLSLIYGEFRDLRLDRIINSVKYINFEDFDFEELNTLFPKESIEKYKTIIQNYPEEEKLLTRITMTLNELEYMCMNISTKVADEKYIYNSLHQQFLKSISLLYISISLSNTDEKDKYYTNIIQVFNIWKDKYVKACEKEKKFKKRLKNKIPKIN